MKSHSSRLWAIVFTTCLASAGCGSGNAVPLVVLKGQVTVDNQPVESGSLQFLPQGDGTATGAEVTNGTYEARVPVGKVRVMIVANKATGRIIEEYSSSFPEVVNIVPPQYQQGIEIEVTGDNDAQHFALVSK